MIELQLSAEQERRFKREYERVGIEFPSELVIGLREGLETQRIMFDGLYVSFTPDWLVDILWPGQYKANNGTS